MDSKSSPSLLPPPPPSSHLLPPSFLPPSLYISSPSSSPLLFPSLTRSSLPLATATRRGFAAWWRRAERTCRRGTPPPGGWRCTRPRFGATRTACACCCSSTLRCGRARPRKTRQRSWPSATSRRRWWSYWVSVCVCMVYNYVHVIMCSLCIFTCIMNINIMHV